MHLHFHANYKKIAPYAVCALLAIDGAFLYNTHKYQAQSQSNQASIVALKKDIAGNQHKIKHPLIRKTVPSAYKKMIDDGKQVQNAENKILDIAYHHKGKLDMSNNDVQDQSNILRQYVAQNASTDNDLYNHSWTDHLKDKVKLIPGASSAMGIYSCAFIVVNPSNNNIDNVISATFDPDAQKFSSFQVYGAYNVVSNQDVTKSNKKDKNNKKKKFTKKSVKKIMNKVNHKKGKKK